MTLMLASVANLAEARLVAEAGGDFIDLKNPATGALGALDVNRVRDIVNTLQAGAADTPATRPVFSATIGDLPLYPETVVPAVTGVAATGVHYVKIGFFPGGKPEAVLDALRPVTAAGTALIAVLFGDHPLDVSLIPRLAGCEFKGVMLDTQDKQRGSLTGQVSRDQLCVFIDTARTAGLMTGLAGSLRLDDIAGLVALKPDYLGFRGALCVGGRADALHPARVRQVRAALLA